MEAAIERQASHRATLQTDQSWSPDLALSRYSLRVFSWPEIFGQFVAMALICSFPIVFFGLIAVTFIGNLR